MPMSLQPPRLLCLRRPMEGMCLSPLVSRRRSSTWIKAIIPFLDKQPYRQRLSSDETSWLGTEVWGRGPGLPQPTRASFVVVCLAVPSVRSRVIRRALCFLIPPWVCAVMPIGRQNPDPGHPTKFGRASTQMGPCAADLFYFNVCEGGTRKIWPL